MFNSFMIILKKIFLNKTILKLSTIFGVSTTTLLSQIDELLPTHFLGMALILWILYGLTVVLDWMTGISAAKYIARKKGVEFKFDKDKSTVSLYKNALFIIMMATIYHFQKEVVANNYSRYIIDGLITIQLIFFAYNMLLEWLSIETNKFKITKKKTRLYLMITSILDIVDKFTLQRLGNFFKSKENDGE